MHTLGTKVVSIGGKGVAGASINAIEIFENPAECTPPTVTFPLCQPRFQHAATLLGDTGFIAIASGRAPGGQIGQSIADLEIVDLN